MADYSTIKGFTIQSLASDPYLSPVGAGTWASGNPLNTARSRIAGCGILTAGLAIAGVNGGPQVAIVETYDGTSWVEGANVNQAREMGTAANQAPATSTVFFGGSASPIPGQANHTEIYDGTSWTEVANMRDARSGMAGAGNSSTSALSAGGEGAITTNTESWDGTSWTEVNNMNIQRAFCSGAGLVTAALAMGGESQATPHAELTATESWDGTCWAEVSALNAKRSSGAGCGIQTSALYFGGNVQVPPNPPGYQTVTEAWNGSTWAEVANLGSEHGSSPDGFGIQTAAVCAGGGSIPGKIAITEEFTVPSGAVSIVQEGQVWYNTTSTVLKGYAQAGTGAWASGTPLNTARGFASGVGTQTEAIVYGGTLGPPGRVDVTEEYDGTTWTEVADMLAIKDNMAGFGTQTAALAAAGEPGTMAETELWDGTSWTEVNDLSGGARAKPGGFGTTASGLATGASPPSFFKTCESWDGTCWTAATSLTSNHSAAAGAAGTSNTTGLVAGGEPPTTALVEEWDGSTWTEIADLNTARYAGVGSGNVAAALMAGGELYPPGTTAVVEQWNGTSWTEVANLAEAGYDGGGTFNSSTATLFAGGYNRPGTITDAVEEWTVPNAIKTFTAS